MPRPPSLATRRGPALARPPEAGPSFAKEVPHANAAILAHRDDLLAVGAKVRRRDDVRVRDAYGDGRRRVMQVPHLHLSRCGRGEQVLVALGAGEEKGSGSGSGSGSGEGEGLRSKGKG